MPKRHFLCVNEPILPHNVSHPRHSHCIHIHKESKEPVGNFIKCDTTLPLISIWTREKSIIHLVRRRYSLSLHLNHISGTEPIDGVSEGRISLTGNYEKKINLTFACSKEKWGRENSNRRQRGKWRDGVKEGLREMPPQREGSWGQNWDNESSQLPTRRKETSDLVKRPKEGSRAELLKSSGSQQRLWRKNSRSTRQLLYCVHGAGNISMHSRKKWFRTPVWILPAVVSESLLDRGAADLTV